MERAQDRRQYGQGLVHRDQAEVGQAEALWDR